ncbi:hypothetical protein GT037_001885, partial [Alternaria burnsii]
SWSGLETLALSTCFWKTPRLRPLSALAISKVTRCSLSTWPTPEGFTGPLWPTIAPPSRVDGEAGLYPSTCLRLFIFHRLLKHAINDANITTAKTLITVATMYVPKDVTGEEDAIQDCISVELE